MNKRRDELKVTAIHLSADGVKRHKYNLTIGATFGCRNKHEESEFFTLSYEGDKQITIVTRSTQFIELFDKMYHDLEDIS